jgi:hypothetical protein
LDVAASSSRVRTILRLLPTEWVGTPRSDEDDFEADKLTLTVDRIDGGNLRCTGATWSDAVVIFRAKFWPSKISSARRMLSGPPLRAVW